MKIEKAKLNFYPDDEGKATPPENISKHLVMSLDLKKRSLKNENVVRNTDILAKNNVMETGNFGDAQEEPVPMFPLIAPVYSNSLLQIPYTYDYSVPINETCPLWMPLNPIQLNKRPSDGKVKWFNPRRGFGYIVVDQPPEEVYVHAVDVDKDPQILKEGERVRFYIVHDVNKPSRKAVSVQPLNDCYSFIKNRDNMQFYSKLERNNNSHTRRLKIIDPKTKRQISLLNKDEKISEIRNQIKNHFELIEKVKNVGEYKAALKKASKFTKTEYAEITKEENTEDKVDTVKNEQSVKCEKIENSLIKEKSMNNTQTICCEDKPEIEILKGQEIEKSIDKKGSESKEGNSEDVPLHKINPSSNTENAEKLINGFNDEDLEKIINDKASTCTVENIDKEHNTLMNSKTTLKNKNGEKTIDTLTSQLDIKDAEKIINRQWEILNTRKTKPKSHDKNIDSLISNPKNIQRVIHDKDIENAHKKSDTIKEISLAASVLQLVDSNK